jgi:hypothetical protein
MHRLPDDRAAEDGGFATGEHPNVIPIVCGDSYLRLEAQEGADQHTE